MKRVPIFLTIFLLFGLINALAQENTLPAEKWQRIETDDKEFSVAFPPNSLVDAEERKFGQKLRVVGFRNGVEMELQIIQDKSLKDRPRMLPPDKANKMSSFTAGEFSILKSELHNSSKFSNNFWFTKKGTLYLLKVTAGTGEEKEVLRFLYSITLQGKPFFIQQDKKDYPEESISVSALKTSPQVAEMWKRKIEKNKISVTYEISSEQEGDLKIAGLTRKYVIFDRPYPAVTAQPGTFGIKEMSARLKIKFMANGGIGDIVVLSTGNKDFTKLCIEAARKIRFIPAQINGQNVDSVGIVDYMAQTIWIATPGMSPMIR